MYTRHQSFEISSNDFAPSLPFFQADNLKKSLVEVNDNSSPSSVKSRLQQVSDLEAEVAAVDEEIANLKKETESNAKSLIRRKVHHINTLQQLGKDPDSGEIFYGISSGGKLIPDFCIRVL